MQYFESEQFGVLRALEINGEMWLVGKDVAEALGYDRGANAVLHYVDEDDRMKICSELRSRFGIELKRSGSWLINESGMYSLVLSSQLPSAKEFQRWVTSVVFHRISRQDLQAAEKILGDPDAMIAVLTALKAERAERHRLEEVVAAQKHQIQIMQPKADYFDGLVYRHTLTSTRKTAKLLGVSRADFVAYLLAYGYVYRDQQKKLLPFEDMIGDLFELVDNGEQLMVTPRGLETFRLLMEKEVKS